MTLSHHHLSESEPPAATPDVRANDPLERAWLLTEAIAANAAAICLESAGDVEGDREVYRVAAGVHDSAVQLRTCLRALALGIDRERVVAAERAAVAAAAEGGKGVVGDGR